MYCRFADNLGDPRGFKIHLVKCGLKKGAVKSNRGNRLHLFFNQAELHSNHREVFTRYIEECHKNIDYLGKLRHDYNMNMTRDQLQAVGMLSQMLSAPWMRRFYRDAQTTFSHMEAFEQVGRMNKYIFSSSQ